MAWLYFAILLLSWLRTPGVRRVPRDTFWRWAAFFAIIGAWITLAVASLIDLQLGNRLYNSVISLDYSVRAAFIDSITRTGIPPQNPFFTPGTPVLLRYHYFWLLGCSLVSRISASALSARQALMAGTLWCGLGLMAVVALYLRLFSPRGKANLRRRTLIGFMLLGVTGLDIVPVVLLLLLYSAHLLAGIPPSVEWWNEQVDGWVYTMLWEPHYMSGLLACLLGFLLIWCTHQETRRRTIVKNGVVAGLAFATAAGSAIYITLVFAIFLATWTVITLFKRWRAETVALLIAGVVATLLSLPYLMDLSGPGAGGPLLQLTVRRFTLVEHVITSVYPNQPWIAAAVNLLFLPLNYFLELGIFFYVGWLIWKRMSWKRFKEGSRPLSRHELASISMLAASVLVCTFFRSSVIGNNDLGWRGFLIAQFVLLIWSADILSEWPGLPAVPGVATPAKQRKMIRVLVCLGAVGTIYDVAILRLFPLLSDWGTVSPIAWMSPDRQLGKRTYANRQAYEWARSSTRKNAVLQYNPDAPQDTFSLLYSNRPNLASDVQCGSAFGGDPKTCGPIVSALQLLYPASGEAGPKALEVGCRTLPIDVLIAKDTDRVWKNRTSWVWTQPPIFANDYVRMFDCRPKR